VFTCFHRDRIRRVKALGPELQVGAIFSQPSEEGLREAQEIGASAVGIHYKNLTREWVEKAHALGLPVRAWNPDTLPEMEAMLELGVDGISSNRPDLLLQLVR